jgi:hypothetical protein
MGGDVSSSPGVDTLTPWPGAITCDFAILISSSQYEKYAAYNGASVVVGGWFLLFFQAP